MKGWTNRKFNNFISNLSTSSLGDTILSLFQVDAFKKQHALLNTNARTIIITRAPIHNLFQTNNFYKLGKGE